MGLPFQCLQCGLCCLGIGEIVRMKEKLGPYEYIVTNEIVREEHIVIITKEFRDLFDNDTSIQREHTSACFFVRRDGAGKYFCTIHPYRLFICKDYACCSARIFSKGKEIGRVKNTWSLVSDDEDLKTFWREKVQKPGLPLEKSIALLNQAGYTTTLYDVTLDHE